MIPFLFLIFSKLLITSINFLLISKFLLAKASNSNVENKEELAEYKSIESKVETVNESNGSLFSNDNTFSREFELKSMSEEELKSLAKTYNITKRKPELIIAEIIKHESKK